MCNTITAVYFCVVSRLDSTFLELIMERSQENDDILNLDNEAKVSSLILLVLITIHLGLPEHVIIPHHPSSYTCLMSSCMHCEYDSQAENFYTLSKAYRNRPYNVTKCYRLSYNSADGNMCPERLCGCA